jgi:hypothetical protein
MKLILCGWVVVGSMLGACIENCCGTANREGENCMVAEMEECRLRVLNEGDMFDVVTASNYDAAAAGREIARIKRMRARLGLQRRYDHGVHHARADR